MQVIIAGMPELTIYLRFFLPKWLFEVENCVRMALNNSTRTAHVIVIEDLVNSIWAGILEAKRKER
jgi:hypothetical protein